MSKRIVYDCETNGLWLTVDTFHCGVSIDIDTGEVRRFRPHELSEFIEHINSAELAVAHNGINYDHPVLQKLSGQTLRRENQFDTLIASRLIWPNIKDKDTVLVRRYNKLKNADQFTLDMYADKARLPGRLFGSHSLAAWGYRLKELKGEYGKQQGAWKAFNEDMLTYCEQDCVVTLKLFRLIEKKRKAWDWEAALQLEHRVSWTMSQQEKNGFYFNVSKAVNLLGLLSTRRDELQAELKDEFGSWYVPTGSTTPKRTVHYKDVLRPDTVEGAAYTKIKQVEFNPASRQHICKVLTERRGWQPDEFTESGQAKVDESVLSKLEWPEAQMLTEYFMLQKRLGQLAEGDQGWLKVVTPEGFIHGSINPCGAVTGRATHSYPNVAQVPSGTAVYGHECRELFTVPDGWVLLGCDASGLELRCLGHFMARWDDGAYIKEILNGDIHTTNQHAAGLPTRSNAKTFIYAFLYGAGVTKLGSIVMPNGTEEEQSKAGRRLKRKFFKALPALKKLVDAVKTAAKRGYLRGLDGRVLHVRSEHAALNVLLQSAGALICKLWVTLIDEIMQQRGYKHGWDGDYAFCAWVHDEVQVAVKPHLKEVIAEVCHEAMTLCEQQFDFRCPLACEPMFGESWKDTH